MPEKKTMTIAVTVEPPDDLGTGHSTIYFTIDDEEAYDFESFSGAVAGKMVSEFVRYAAKELYEPQIRQFFNS